MPTIEQLRQMQAMSLDEKVLLTQRRIEEWYYRNKGKVVVSFSGGKDSTVLLHITRQIFPDVPALFVNTGLEYPEIRQFALSFDNVTEVRPRWGSRKCRGNHDPDDVISFMDVVLNYGYPIISKEVSNTIHRSRSRRPSTRWSKLTGEISQGNAIKSRYDISKYYPLYQMPFKISQYCCNVMKKAPGHKHYADSGLKQIVGTMADESVLRETAWMRTGCNSFDEKRPMSKPMSFWLEQDVLRYIVENQIEICSVYGEVCATDTDGNYYAPEHGLTSGLPLTCTGCKRTGCMFCAFGAHLEKGETRFQRIKRTHPKIYEYCMGGGEWVQNANYDTTKTDADDWNPRELWVPSRKGLGMAKVFDMVNEIYGKEFLRYD